MIKHIVLWNYKKEKEKEMNIFLEKLEGLYGIIVEIKNIEIRRNINNNGKNFDVIFMVTFCTIEDMKKYMTDTRHLEVAKLCTDVVTDRVTIDCEE